MAAYSLGEIGDRRAVEPLIAQLQNTDPHLRRIAARALGKIGDPRAVPYLARLVLDQQQPLYVRWDAATALGMIGDPRALEPLGQVARGEKGQLQKEAVQALARLEQR